MPQYFETLSAGQAYTILDTTATSLLGTTYALPPRANVINWQHIETGGPSAASLSLAASLDGVNFITMDTEATPAGGMKTVTFNAYRFIRAALNTRTGGTNTKVILSVANN